MESSGNVEMFRIRFLHIYKRFEWHNILFLFPENFYRRI